MAKGVEVEFSAKLKRLRLATGKTKYELAKLAGIDQAFLGRLESGERGPTRETVFKIAFALGHHSDVVSIHDIDELLMDGGFAPLSRPR